MDIKVVICNDCKKFHGGHISKCECGCQTLSETHHSNYDAIEWQETDPDNHQYGRQLGEDLFQFKEFNTFNIFPRKIKSEDLENPTNWIDEIVDFSKLSESDIEDAISSYYSSLEEVKENYEGDFWKWIVAECYFEQNSGMY